MEGTDEADPTETRRVDRLRITRYVRPRRLDIPFEKRELHGALRTSGSSSQIHRCIRGNFVARLRALRVGETMRVPRYDKSAHGGLGDRAAEAAWPVIDGPIDVVVLEGGKPLQEVIDLS